MCKIATPSSMFRRLINASGEPAGHGISGSPSPGASAELARGASS